MIELNDMFANPHNPKSRAKLCKLELREGDESALMGTVGLA